ncbi:MAG: hypothetical protein AB7I98_03815 [Verrucomicrobiales bacterium]
MSENLPKREEIASEILGVKVRDGSTMPCRYAIRHNSPSGPRDLRVMLTGVPTFHCFHASCAEAWEKLNKELRSKIAIAETGRRPSRDSDWGHGKRVSQAPDIPRPGRRDFDLSALKRVGAMAPKDSWSPEYFRERSPVPVASAGPWEFVEALYEPGELVLVMLDMSSQGDYAIWRGKGTYRLGSRPGVAAVPSWLPEGSKDGVWFLCNPVDGKWYPNPRSLDDQGRPKMSRRSQEAVISWRYLVLESDEAPPAWWLRFLAQLAMPISAIYTSGGRSIHSLIKVGARTKEEWDGIKATFIGLLTKLGADPKALSAVRLTRLPGCLRGNRLQELYFLDPDPPRDGTPICERLALPLRSQLV